VASQLDLDQGGTSREWVRAWRGPSVGWIYVPMRNVLMITAAGTYALDPSTSLVEVNVNGLVTVVLPSAVTPTVGPQALPGLFAQNPVTIVDIGGFASGANPITIQRNNANENVLGLTQIQITAQYGGFSLRPSSTQKGWTNPS
jgi:hypothetical protein